jgi:hypothetical protein
LAGCFLALISRGDERRAFDVIKTLHASLSKSIKSSDDVNPGLACRAAGVHVLGKLNAKYGSQFRSMGAESASLFLKAARGATGSAAGSQYDLSVRVEAINAFSLIVSSKAIVIQPDSALVKDWVKFIKSGFSDRCQEIRQACADAFTALLRHFGVPSISTSSEVETALYALVKGMEGANFETRVSISKSVSQVLLATQNTGFRLASRSKPGSSASSTAASPSFNILGIGNNADTGNSSNRQGGAFGQNKSGTAEGHIGNATSEEYSLASCREMLRFLISFFVKSTGRDVRVGIIECYIQLIDLVGVSYVEANYTDLVGHIVEDLLGHPKIRSLPMSELIVVFELLVIVMRRIGFPLSESFQLNGIKLLIEHYVAGLNQDISTLGLSLVITEISGLISNLGGITSMLPEHCVESLVLAASHGSHWVQISAGLTLQQLVLNVPSLYSGIFFALYDSLQKDLSALTSSSADHLRPLGTSLALSGIFPIASQVPLHVPNELATLAFSLATNTLKSSAQKESKKVSITLHTVAWTLLSGLMAMDATSVKSHLSQCIMLWKEALSKPTSISTSMIGESLFDFISNKEGALRSLTCFTKHHPSLLTNDLGQKLAVLVVNGIQLISSHVIFTGPYPVPVSTIVPPCRLNYQELEMLFRKRLVEGVTALSRFLPHSTVLQTNKMFVEWLTPDPSEIKVPDFASAYPVISSYEKFETSGSCGNLSWASAEQGSACYFFDQLVFGASSMLSSYSSVPSVELESEYGRWAKAERFLHHAIQPSPIFDLNSVIFQASCKDRFAAPPIPFAFLNSMASAWAHTFTVLAPSNQAGPIEEFIRLLNVKYERQNRKLASMVNIITMLTLAFNIQMDPNSSWCTSKLPSEVVKHIFEISRIGLSQNDSSIRSATAFFLGKVAEKCSAAAVSFLSQSLINLVVEHREPEIRAGSALAMAQVHIQSRSTSGLKSTANVLHSLCTDGHVMVSQTATLALSRLLEHCPLELQPLVYPATLSVVSKQLHADHKPKYVARILHGCIDVLGPELQISHAIRDLLCQFIDYLLIWEGTEESAESWQAVAQMTIMVPNAFSAKDYSTIIHATLLVPNLHSSLLRSLLACLCHIAQRNSAEVLSSAPGIEKDLMKLVIFEPELVVKVLAVFTDSVSDPTRWIQLCKDLLFTTSDAAVAVEENKAAVGSDTEEEPDEVKVSSPGQANESGSMQAVKWVVKKTAIETLRNVISTVARSTHRKYHVDLKEARNMPGDWLVLRLGDLIRIAFTASTSLTTPVRAEGLRLLEDILIIFADSIDPDIASHKLLEQYQAQFSSALTPALASDTTSPELVVIACHVCARYVGSRITSEIYTLSRITTMLSQALERIRKSAADKRSIPNAHLTISLAVLGAWAHLASLSSNQAMLKEIVDPHLPSLTSLWLSSLRDFSFLKANIEGYTPTEIRNDSRSFSITLLARDLVLPMYKSHWSSILEACVPLLTPSVVEEESKGKVLLSNGSTFVFKLIGMLLGLAFEPLISPQTSEDVKMGCLKAIGIILHPDLYQSQVIDKVVLEILISVERLSQTSSHTIHSNLWSLLGQLLQHYYSMMESSKVIYRAQRVLFSPLVAAIPGLLLDPSSALIFMDMGVDRTDSSISACLTILNVAAHNTSWVPLALHCTACVLELPLFRAHLPRIILALKQLMESITLELQSSDHGRNNDGLMEKLVLAFVDNLANLISRGVNEGNSDHSEGMTRIFAALTISAGILSKHQSMQKPIAKSILKVLHISQNNHNVRNIYFDIY